MDQQPPLSGFPSHIQQQFQQASEQVLNMDSPSTSSNRGVPHRGRGGRARSNVQSMPHRRNPSLTHQLPSTSQPDHERGPRRGRGQRMHSQALPPAHGSSQVPPSSENNDFPPLGPVNPQRGPTSFMATSTSQWSHPEPTPAEQARARDFFNHNRGRGRGQHMAAHSVDNVNVQPQQHSEFRSKARGEHRYSRPARGQLYNPLSHAQAMHQYHDPTRRRMVMLQSDYMNEVAYTSFRSNNLTIAEQKTKEAFRLDLEKEAQKAISHYADEETSFAPANVKLVCYGSLSNGFGLPGCDMDLLLSFLPSEGSIRDVQAQSPRILEKTFLDLGYGARLLTNTRVPILRVCQKPTVELLANLRKNREIWEEEQEVLHDYEDSQILPDISQEQADDAAKGFAELGNLPTEVALPPSPVKEHAQLEFKGDCGIQCDINFSNHVAIHNTRLLRAYCDMDPRVRQLGLFVKLWAKTRGINTPYHGTLSSYGYVLMVLHFLMNIANPPLIPNLQHLARDHDAWNDRTEIPLFEGFDIRFISDSDQIRAIRQGLGQNSQNTGSLLRDLFWYYGHNQGFNWTQEVISLRTKGGILRKHQKGWTGAKWTGENNHIRLRYLLCIEDPFEVEHNIARTIGHSGIVTIRDEFRRGLNIIESIERTRSGWQWHDGDNATNESFLEKVQDRGDLLKQDQQAYREKMRKEREAQKNTEALVNVNDDWGSPAEANEATGNGTSQDPESAMVGGHGWSDQVHPKLTSVGPQDDRWHMDGRIRKVKDDDESDSESEAPGDVAGARSVEGAWDVGVTGEKHDCKAPAQELSELIEAEHPPEQSYASHGLQAVPRPQSWDMSTESGRWLMWRDNKIRDGLYQGPNSQYHHDLDAAHPYDPLRTVADPDYGVWKPQDIFPPWPLKRQEIIVQAKPIVDEQEQSSPLAIHDGSSEAGREVMWDKRTIGGRWLRWRDRAVRRGDLDPDKPLPPTAIGHQLHAAFPYDPAISGAELDRLNEVLRKQYCNRTFAPWFQFESSVKPLLEPAAAAAASSLEAEPQSVEESSEPQADDPDHASGTVTPTSEPGSGDAGLVDDHKTGEPTLEMIRARRLAFFASNAIASNGKQVMDAAPEVRNVQTLMHSAGIDAKSQPEPGDRWAVVQSTEQGPSHTRESRQKTNAPTPLEAVRAQSEPDRKAPALAQTARYRPKYKGEANKADSCEQSEVPASLHRDMPKDERRREDVPDIMPIPRRPGFQFDPRQLRDIKVMQKGGNGCARRGDEYEFEDDYDFGGGGLMGWGKSSSAPHSGAHTGDEWVKGTGDEEGLLDELPGFA